MSEQQEGEHDESRTNLIEAVESVLIDKGLEVVDVVEHRSIDKHLSKVDSILARLKVERLGDPIDCLIAEEATRVGLAAIDSVLDLEAPAHHVDQVGDLLRGSH